MAVIFLVVASIDNDAHMIHLVHYGKLLLSLVPLPAADVSPVQTLSM